MAAPSFRIENDVLVIEDSNAATSVGGYVLGLFNENGQLAYKLAVTNGAALDLSAVAKGTYTAKLMAKGANALYSDSDWSTVTATVVSTTEVPSQLIEFGENGYTWAQDGWGPLGIVTQRPGNWFYWNDQNWNGSNVAVSNVELVGGVVHATYNCTSGSNALGFQLFYDVESNVAGKTYTLKLTITSTANTTIKVNEKEYNLVANQAQDIEVTFVEPEVVQYAGASIVIQVSVKAGDQATITVANMTMEESNGGSGNQNPTPSTGTKIEFGENGYTWAQDGWGPLGAVTQNPGNWFYWNDQNWNGSYVAVSNVELVDGVVHATYNCTNGSNPFGFQLFYDVESNEAGKTYTLKLTITSTADTTIKVNDQEFNLVANQAQEIEVTFVEPEVVQYAGASIVIQFGVKAGDQATITVANMTMVEAAQ